jgi:hypothetical protein
MTKDNLEQLLEQYANPAMRRANSSIWKPLARQMREDCKKYGIEIPYWLEE